MRIHFFFLKNSPEAGGPPAGQGLLTGRVGSPLAALSEAAGTDARLQLSHPSSLRLSAVIV